MAEAAVANPGPWLTPGKQAGLSAALAVALCLSPLMVAGRWMLLALVLAQPFFSLALSIWRGTRSLSEPNALSRDLLALTTLWTSAYVLLALIVGWPLEALRESGALTSALSLSLAAGVGLLGLWRVWPVIGLACRIGGSLSLVLASTAPAGLRAAGRGLGLALAVFAILASGLLFLWPGLLPATPALLSAHLLLALAGHALIQRLAREWEVPLDRRVGVLSGGERQKVATLLALGHRPDLLVMDEPASGLDPVARRAFMVTLLEIAAESGRTILFSSHIVSDIERIASHVWMLREGEIAWQGELDHLKESTVRVVLRAERDFASPPQVAGALHCQVQGSSASLVLRDWTPDMLQQLEQQTGARGEVTPLTLEDIFLAVHS